MDKPAKHLSSESTPIEGIYVELKFRKKNWLLCCTYNPNRNIITNHLDVLKRSLEPYSTKYANLVVIGDLKAEVNLEYMKLFCETYNLSNLIKVPTCYKNPEIPSCIDLLLTNRPQNSSVVETGLSDFNKMTVIHCIKYARIQVFTDPYSPVLGQNLRFFSYTGKYGSVKTHILAYFMTAMVMKTTFQKLRPRLSHFRN